MIIKETFNKKNLVGPDQMSPGLFLTLKKPDLPHRLVKDTAISHPKTITHTHYLLHFITGKVTLPFFKKLLLSSKVKEIVVYACNVERFEFVFREFRDLEFVIKEYGGVPSYRTRYVYADKDRVFEPPVFDCVITSLTRLELYMSRENASTGIIKTLLRDNAKKLEESKELMSLVRFGAVSKTKNGYKTTF